tara:strand:+ start:428 stop:664 length:237 start_codon:yes stop_codon:yes gene_type:complete
MTMNKRTYGKNCEPCNVSMVYPTPQGAAMAYSNHTRSKQHRSGVRSEERTYKGDPGQLYRYGFNSAAQWLETKQEQVK